MSLNLETWERASQLMINTASKLSIGDLFGIVRDLANDVNKKLDKIGSKISGLMQSYFIAGLHYL